jgi:hypothetical protein
LSFFLYAKNIFHFQILFCLKEGNIDVSLLHCGLNTEQEIAEEQDVVWDWTKLFTEVVSTLNASNKDAEEKNNENQISFKSEEQNDVFKNEIEKSSTVGVKSRRERNIEF